VVSNFESPPWMIGGNVRHSVNIARVLAYAAFGGDEGIIGPKDLEVAATSTASGNVRIFPGVCSINNRGTGIKYEGYIGRLAIEDTLAIAATGGSGRADLVVVRVENPYQTGEPFTPPASGVDPNTVPYIRPYVISGVSSTATQVKTLGLGYSAIPLARINMPANVSTVQQGYITDLRNLTNVRQYDTFKVASPVATTVLTSPAGTYVAFPPAASMSVAIPEWATHMMAKATLAGVKYGGAVGTATNVYGNVRLTMGSMVSQTTSYDFSVASSYDRSTIFAGSPGIAVPAAMRGTTATLQLEGVKAGGTTSLTADPQTTASLDVRFYQQPETNL
jgi:hypothetical protein